MIKFLVLVSLFSGANGLDEATQSRLIEKLTQVNLNLAPNDSSKTSILLRLADLHAEQGRRLANKEINEGCNPCTAGTRDRKKAIELYGEALPHLQNEQKSRVLTQMGHIHELVGQEAKAISIYEQLLKNESPAIAAEAQLSLAEIYFKKRNFPLSLEFYQKVKNTHPSQKGLAAYRSGWCLFNMSQIEKAAQELKTVLSSQELLSRSTGGVVSVDKQFQEEVSRDYATFLSRLPFSEKHIEELYVLSPENAKLAHAQYLASEYERLGQVPASIAAWRFVIARQSDPKARLEGHVHLAQLQAQHQQRDKAVQDFSSSLSLWKGLGQCVDDTCKNLKIRLKQFVVDWSTLEKKQASEELLDVYKQYLSVFPEEHDLRLWQAQAAQKKADYGYAMTENLYVAQALSQKEKTQLSEQEKTWLETSLLAAIECAELSQKTEAIELATGEYLSKSIDRKKETDVRYQRAQMVYEAAKYDVAAQRFRELATDAKASQDLRAKSADLALDSLVLLKDDVRLELWAKELSLALPASAAGLMGVARKSVLTQVAQKAEANDLQGAWTVLNRFDVQGATPEEKNAYLKNKLILAEKLKNFSSARDAAEELLRQSTLSKADKEYALSRKAWLAELQFDFTTALAATEKMEMKGEEDKKFLKLALLADLAGKDASPYYRSFLKVSQDSEKSVAVAMELVRKSGYSIKELDGLNSVLKQNPESLSMSTYEVYSQTGNAKVLDRIINDKKMAKTAYGMAAVRTHLLSQFVDLQKKIQGSVIDSSHQKKLAASLKNRVALLTSAEKAAAQAVDAGEWSSQVAFLNLLATENERFYNEVLSLPVPEGLSDEEEQQYLNLLSQQAAPHQTKANDIRAKLAEIYSRKESFSTYRSVVDSQKQPIRKVFIQEMTLLRSVVPQEYQSLLADVSSEKAEGEKPTLAQVENARQAVREQPFEKKSIEGLIGLEKMLGRTSMVSYLENRLATLDNSAESTKK